MAPGLLRRGDWWFNIHIIPRYTSDHDDINKKYCKKLGINEIKWDNEIYDLIQWHFWATSKKERDIYDTYT